MDECPVFFEVPLPPAPIPEPTGPLWFYNDPDLCGALTFDEEMDTTVQPRGNQLQFLIDGLQFSTTTFTWGTNVMAQSNRDFPGLTPTDVNLILPVSQNKYRTALGAIVPPYDLEAFHVIPSGIGSRIFLVQQTSITFNLLMDTSVQPPLSNWEVIIDGVPFTPDSSSWISDTTIRINVGIGVPVDPTYTIEFLNASNGLRSSTGAVMCPFKLVVTFP